MKTAGINSWWLIPQNWNPSQIFSRSWNYSRRFVNFFFAIFSSQSGLSCFVQCQCFSLSSLWQELCQKRDPETSELSLCCGFRVFSASKNQQRCFLTFVRILHGFFPSAFLTSFWKRKKKSVFVFRLETGWMHIDMRTAAVWQRTQTAKCFVSVWKQIYDKAISKIVGFRNFNFPENLLNFFLTNKN